MKRCRCLCRPRRTELLQRVQNIQRMVAEEPLYTVKPTRAGAGSHKPVREAATVVRDPNLEAATAILQELENEHEFLCAALLPPDSCLGAFHAAGPGCTAGFSPAVRLVQDIALASQVEA